MDYMDIFSFTHEIGYFKNWEDRKRKLRSWRSKKRIQSSICENRFFFCQERYKFFLNWTWNDKSRWSSYDFAADSCLNLNLNNRCLKSQDHSDKCCGWYLLLQCFSRVLGKSASVEPSLHSYPVHFLHAPKHVNKRRCQSVCLLCCWSRR